MPPPHTTTRACVGSSGCVLLPSEEKGRVQQSAGLTTKRRSTNRGSIDGTSLSCARLERRASGWTMREGKRRTYKRLRRIPWVQAVPESSTALHFIGATCD